MTVWSAFQRPTIVRVTQRRGGTVYGVDRIALPGAYPHILADAMDRELLRDTGFVAADREWSAHPWTGARGEELRFARYF